MLYRNFYLKNNFLNLFSFKFSIKNDFFFKFKFKRQRRHNIDLVTPLYGEMIK